MKTKLRSERQRSEKASRSQSANLQTKGTGPEGISPSAIATTAALNAAKRLTRLLGKPAPDNGEWNLFLATAYTDLKSSLGDAPKPGSPPSESHPSPAGGAEKRANSTIGPIEFTEAEFRRVLDAVNTLNQVPPVRLSLTAFAAQAIRHETNRVLFPGKPLFELEDASNRAIGLLLMLGGERISKAADYKPGDIRGTAAAGVDMIIGAAADHLHAAVDSAQDYAAGRAA